MRCAPRLYIWGLEVRRQCTVHHQRQMATSYFILVEHWLESDVCVEATSSRATVQKGVSLFERSHKAVVDDRNEATTTSCVPFMSDSIPRSKFLIYYKRPWLDRGLQSRSLIHSVDLVAYVDLMFPRSALKTWKVSDIHTTLEGQYLSPYSHAQKFKRSKSGYKRSLLLGTSLRFRLFLTIRTIAMIMAIKTYEVMSTGLLFLSSMATAASLENTSVDTASLSPAINSFRPIMDPVWVEGNGE